MRRAGVLGEDRLLHRPQLASGFEAELVDQSAPGVAVGLQRVGLAATAVERQHQLAPQALAKGVFGDHGLEVANQLRMASQFEVRGDPILEGTESELLQPGDLRLRERLECEVGERRPTPESKCGAQPIGGGGGVAGGERLAPLQGEILETPEVELLRREFDRVPRSARHDGLLRVAVGVEQLS